MLAGSLRWVPRALARRLRRYVEDGGRLASFGTESLRRGVRVGPNRLTRPTQPTPTDPFGARLEPARAARAPARTAAAPVPLTALADDPALGLLTGSDGVVDAFGRLEESQARAERGARRWSMALGQDVTDAERADAEAKGEQPRKALPALTATRLGEGLVVRVGLTDWVQAGRAGPRGRPDHAQHRRRAAPGQAARALGGPLRIPSSAIRSRSGVRSRSARRPANVSAAARRPRRRAAARARRARSGSGSPYQSSAPWWRASSAPAR